ncbi:hydroxyacid dehydrogenase [bacterium]|nr:hydroxyacid dehydrogenase [bacterium]
MTLRVHFNQLRFPDGAKAFKAMLDPEITVTVGDDVPNPANYDILVHPHPSADWIKASPDLRAVVIPWAGIPEDTRAVMADFPDVSVHNLHHNNFNTAELGFALLLTAAKRLIPMDQALRNDDWTPRFEGPKAVLLRGQTALILGFGEIGQALADYCLGLGMKVIATKRHLDGFTPPANVKVHPADQLHDLLPSADVLLIALPHTDETDGLIGEAELDLMPAGGILVNIGRGPVVQQEALYNALTSGHLRAAGSDVWYNYPKSRTTPKNNPPADFPFGELDNFVLSPHRGGMVEDVESQRADALARLLNTANRGDPIPNRVDLDAGY